MGHDGNGPLAFLEPVSRQEGRPSPGKLSPAAKGNRSLQTAAQRPRPGWARLPASHIPALLRLSHSTANCRDPFSRASSRSPGQGLSQTSQSFPCTQPDGRSSKTGAWGTGRRTDERLTGTKPCARCPGKGVV